MGNCDITIINTEIKFQTLQGLPLGVALAGSVFDRKKAGFWTLK